MKRLLLLAVAASAVLFATASVLGAPPVSPSPNEGTYTTTSYVPGPPTVTYSYTNQDGVWTIGPSFTSGTAGYYWGGNLREYNYDVLAYVHRAMLTGAPPFGDTYEAWVYRATDGSGKTDANGNPLTMYWAFGVSSLPSGSGASVRYPLFYSWDGVTFFRYPTLSWTSRVP